MEQELDLTRNNPYASGYIINYDDETQELQTDLPIYEDDIQDKFESFNEGDTLQNLAGKWYSDSKLWHVLYHANLDVIDDPLNLPVGAIYRIPHFRT